jgi:hypothetical protein
MDCAVVSNTFTPLQMVLINEYRRGFPGTCIDKRGTNGVPENRLGFPREAFLY